MSWGERSCSMEKAPKNEYGGCAVATMNNCNVNCRYYTWDGVTKPDSELRASGKGAYSHKNSDRNLPCPCGSGLKFKKCCW
jgi:hypothetical protein